MYHQYFSEGEVKPEFKKEFISLWSGWLGDDNYHKLDEVTETEWSRFNHFIKSVSADYLLGLVSLEKMEVCNISDIEKTFSNYLDSMEKDSSKFTIYLCSELDCVISEDWDYTYIIWYKCEETLQKLVPYIKSANLHHFT